MTSHTFPPILAPAPSATVLQSEQDVVIVLHVGRFVGWLLSLLPVWEEISREEAARFILAREIRVKYTPIILELDRDNPNIEVR